MTSVGRKDEHVAAGTVRDLFCGTIPVLLQYQLDQDMVHELPPFPKHRVAAILLNSNGPGSFLGPRW